MSVILETPRLVLREMTLDDLDFMAEMLGDAEVMRFYPQVCDRAAARESIVRNLERYAQHGFGLWLAILKETNHPVGRIGLIRQHVEGRAEDEIGYMIHRPYWRQGLASEGAAGVREYALQTLGKRRLISLVRPVNIPSQRTALRNGMLPEKLVLHYDLEHLVFSLQR